MRIISGEAKGRSLRTPGGRGTRPTDSRAREALFNILGERVVNARVLDLYAGTGALGLEALSRGADFCVFVEQDTPATKIIRANVRMLGWDDRVQVWNATVKSVLRRLVENLQTGGQRFNLILADPPFARPEALPDLCKRLH